MPAPVAPRRSFKRHLLAWIVAGIGCGWSDLPSFSVATLLAFAVAGCIVGLVLALATYPVSRQPILVLVGATCGASIGWLGVWQSPAAAGANLPGLCLMIGGLIGATAAIWQTPLRLLSVIAAKIGTIRKQNIGLPA